MLLLIPSRYRHFILLALGLALLVYGLAAGTKGAALIGGAVLVYGLLRTAQVLRGARRPTNIGSSAGR